VKCCMQKKGSKDSAPLDKYALQAAQRVECRCIQDIQNTCDYFDASSDKNRVVRYWIASVVQPTIDLGSRLIGRNRRVNYRRIGKWSPRFPARQYSMRYRGHDLAVQ